eukprot:TRINITY_DN11898_c0_g1_i2.p1 TRINITY_DN11898_c0_g1~~TRINITY_DN11898_c0_g1_i2.p1  ORF type:complete len:129 (+),score=46.38 TRINITY_DN11898_c0_g1_i2:69-455(+)
MCIRDRDKISVILMLAFAEYVIKTKIGMKELFKEEGNAVKSSAFFDVLRGIGINIEENEHPNLKQFLCYSDMNLDLFSLSKLEAIVKQFETNEELREFAHKCYEELMNEERPITEEKEEQLTESNNLP